MKSKVIKMKKLVDQKLTQRIICNTVIEEIAERGDVFFHELDKGVWEPCYVDKKKNEVAYLKGIQFETYIKGIAASLKDTFDENYTSVGNCILSSKETKTIADTAVLSPVLRTKEKIKPFAFKSDECLTFCRLPFDPVDEYTVTPNWAGLLNGFTNAEALMAWIGSLFFEQSDRSQYLWLYGQGRNGKSTIARVLRRMLGDFMKFEVAPDTDSQKQYLSYGLMNKRLVVFDDFEISTKNGNFIRSGIFKGMTGSSKIAANCKYKMSCDIEINAKFLFTANSKPQISNESADLRRVIYCESKNIPFKDDHKFEDKLYDELGNFISNCMLLYQDHCPNFGVIPVDKDQVQDAVSEFYESAEAWIDARFIYKEDSYVRVVDFCKSVNDTPHHVNKRKLYSFLESQGCFRKGKRILGHETRVISGIEKR